MNTPDMEDTVPKKVSTKPFITQKGWVTKPHQNFLTRKERMDEETQRDLRRKKLFFRCI
jgi:hypothetical protein